MDEALRTCNPRVGALGDCNGKGAFTHTAYIDCEIVADNLLNGTSRGWADRAPMCATTPVAEFQRHVRIHPTVSELLPTVTEALKPLQ